MPYAISTSWLLLSSAPGPHTPKPHLSQTRIPGPVTAQASSLPPDRLVIQLPGLLLSISSPGLPCHQPSQLSQSWHTSSFWEQDWEMWGERPGRGRKSSLQQQRLQDLRRCRISELDASDPGWSVLSASQLHMASAELGCVGPPAASGRAWGQRSGVRSSGEALHPR